MPPKKNKNSPLISSGPSAIAEIQPEEKPVQARSPGTLRMKIKPEERSTPSPEAPVPQPSAPSTIPAAPAGRPPAKRRKTRKRPRILLRDALRQEGLDERRIAEAYFKVVGTLTGQSGQGQEKVLVDVLDKCAKVLEPIGSGERAHGGGPVIVQLIHDVPRPAYEKPALAAKLLEKENPSEK